MMKKWLLIPFIAVGMLGAVRAEQPGVSPVYTQQGQAPVYVQQQPQGQPQQQVAQGQTVVTERDPELGAPLPEGKVYESKKSWEFDDDELDFKNSNPNPDGKRYLVWKDYHWIIGDNEITVIDPRPYGTSITSARRTVDRKGRVQKDEKVMDSLKDQAGDIRRSREPVYYAPPAVIGIGFGFGYYGGGYYGHHHHHGGHYHGGGAPRYRYR
jgi:hypothetical protein